MAQCGGDMLVRVDNSFLGVGTTKEDALANLLDQIAEAAESRLKCRESDCPEGRSCEPYIEASPIELQVKYGRAGGRWTASLFGPNQPGLSQDVTVFCRCVPASEDDQHVLASTWAPTRAAAKARAAPKGILLAIDDHVPGKRCVDGLVTGKASKVAPVTDPDKGAAERAVLEAGRASAIADAQARCEEGRCDPADGECTFVKILEGSSITSTPSRDPNGNIVWTCTLVSFEVLGPCVCRRASGEDEKKGGKRKK